MPDVSQELQFQISLLSIALPGAAEPQTRELEELLSQTESAR
jgi:hypothetical protein